MVWGARADDSNMFSKRSSNNSSSLGVKSSDTCINKTSGFIIIFKIKAFKGSDMRHKTDHKQISLNKWVCNAFIKGGMADKISL